MELLFTMNRAKFQNPHIRKHTKVKKQKMEPFS